MTKEHGKLLSSTCFPLILALGVLALVEGQSNCESLTNKCGIDVRKANGVSETDINNIMRRWRNINRWPNTGTVNKEDQDKICKVSTDQIACYAKHKGQCEQDAYFTAYVTDAYTKMEQFECPGDNVEDCDTQLRKCVTFGNRVSSLEVLKEFETIRDTTEDKKTLIAQMGRIKGCLFVKSFTECFDKVKAKCEKAKGVKETLVATEEIKTQHECGQVSKCEDSLKTCQNEDVDLILLGRIVGSEWKISGMNVKSLLKHITNSNRCSFEKDYKDCYAKINGQCSDKDGLYFRIVSDIVNLAKTEFKCSGDATHCEEERDKCRDQGIVVSKVTQNELDAILTAKQSGNQEQLQTLIGQIGKERGCPFVETFDDCQKKINDKCNSEEPNFKPVLELTKMAHDQLHCGCASTVASLLLILAAILLMFYRNSFH